MVPWESLPEDLRQANIAQAAGIGDKMEAIGAIIVPESAGAPEFQFTGEEVERLAEQEHERWMRDKLSQGWRYGQPRDDERKIHPDLLAWAALSEADKDKDRNAIRDPARHPARRGLPDPPPPAGLLARARQAATSGGNGGTGR